MDGTGILALWNDRDPLESDFYEDWYIHEHMPERLDIPGFLLGRRFVRIDGEGSEFFTYYRTTAPEVLFSDDYLARINAPTDTTRRVMSEVMRGMSRTVCRVTRRAGRAHGAFAVAAILPEAAAAPDPADLVRVIGRARAEVWEAVSAPGAENAEQRMRGGDNSVPACLVVETLTEGAARAVSEKLGRAGLQPGLFRLLCDMAG